MKKLCRFIARLAAVAALPLAVSSAAVADFTPVVIKGHPAHPTRVLARLAPQAQKNAAIGALATGGLQVEQRYALVPGLLVLDEAPAAPGAAAAAAPTASPEEQARALADRIETLRASGLFDYVEPDYLVHAEAVPTDARFADGTLWGLRNTGQSGGVSGVDIDAVRAWDVTTGSTNVIVAVIDSGIRTTHRDLSAQLWHNPNEVAGNGIDDDHNGYVDDVHGIDAITGTGDPMDDNSHGTHVAGTIGAAANDGNPVVGVAWQVRLMACKFLPAEEGGLTSDAIECIDYAVRNGARILNNSWSGGGRNQALYDSIAAARDRGVLFVAAAGNEGQDNDSEPQYPSSYDLDNIIAVAAIDRAGSRASFSNIGARTVDLGAPGVDIYSTITGADGNYGVKSGTSMATPHVTGVAALVQAQFPGIAMADLRDRILNTTDVTAPLQTTTATGGRVNAYRAVSAVPSGQLRVAMSSPGRGTALFRGRATPVVVRVTDLLGVTGATVTAAVSNGAALTFRDDGVAPDAVAGDANYSATLSVPATAYALSLTISASAAGKTAGSVAIDYVVREPPPNDDFADRAVLPFNIGTATGSNDGGTREPGEPDVAGQQGGASLWWTWTASGEAAVTLDTVGSSFDTLLGVYTGSAVDGLTEIASNDDIDGPNQPSRVRFTAHAGGEYQIVVDGWEGKTGSIRLNIATSLAPRNDSFANRAVIPASSRSVTGSLVNATLEPEEPAHSTGAAVRCSAWWTWTADTSGTANFWMMAGSGYGIAIYTGNSLSTLARVPPYYGELQPPYFRANTVAVSAGTTYQIAILSVDEQPAGAVRLDWSVLAPPANDAFGNRTRLVGESGDVTGTNNYATRESGEPRLGPDADGATVWWTWTAPRDETVVFDLSGYPMSQIVAVYTGSTVSALVRMAGNDEASGQYQTRRRLSLPVVGGVSYQIAVDGTGTRGALSFRYWTVEPPDNDAFADRTTVRGASASFSGDLAHASCEPGEPVHDIRGWGQSAWWTWTAPTTGTARLGTRSPDAIVAVYTGQSLHELTPVNRSGSSPGEYARAFQFHATAGTSYHIAADVTSGTSDTEVEMDLTLVAGPANDQFADRASLAGSVAEMVGTALQATCEAGEPLADPSVWWTWTAPAAGTVLITQPTGAASLFCNVAIYRGTALDALAQVSGQTFDSETDWLAFPAAAGDVFQIRVGGGSHPEAGFAVRLALVTAPANDDFSTRERITGSAIEISGTTEGASYESPGPAIGAASVHADVWWTWTASASGNVVITTDGSDIHAAVGVYQGGELGSLRQVARSPGYDTGYRPIVFGTIAGVTYIIGLEGNRGEVGRFRLQIRVVAPPTNDRFANRSALTGSSIQVSASNWGAGTEPDERNHGGNPAASSIWWSWTAPAGGRTVVTASSVEFVPVLAVYRGDSLAALTPVASAGRRDLEVPFARVVFDAVAGTTYTIVVDSADAYMGDLVFDLVMVEPPANDNFADRAAVSGGDVVAESNSFGCAVEPGEPRHGLQERTGSVWWTWTAPETLLYVISTAGSDYDTLLAVYTGNAVGALTNVGSNADVGGGDRTSELVLNGVAGTTYQIAVGGENLAMGNVVLNITGVDLPEIALSVSANQVTAGAAVRLSATAVGTGPFSYQWLRDGVEIPGATEATLDLPSAQHFHAGTYTVLVTWSYGVITSSGAMVTVDAPAASESRLLNLSTRALCRTGDDVLIPGFVIDGAGTKRLLIRAVGPTLGVDPFNIAGVLPNPKLTLKRMVDGHYQDIASNDDWGTNANADEIRQTAARLWAFNLGEGSADAALLVDLPVGQYTAVASDVDAAGTGLAIVEFYDADEAASTAKLANLSNRGYAGVGDQIMIPGVIISDEGPKTLLVRAVGPGLAPFGVGGLLADPQVAIYRDGDRLLSNDDWGVGADAAETAQVAEEVFAFPLASGSADAAFVVTLPAGAYTVQATGVGETTGVVLVEVYLVP